MENNISSATMVLSGCPRATTRATSITLMLTILNLYLVNLLITFKVFADDLKLYSSLDTNFHRSRLQEAINSVVAWSITRKLPINFPKCLFLHIGTNNPLYRPIYYLNSLQLPCQTPRAILVLILIPCSGTIITTLLSHVRHNLE